MSLSSNNLYKCGKDSAQIKEDKEVKLFFQKQQQDTDRKLKKMLLKDELRRINRIHRYDEELAKITKEPEVRVQDTIIKIAEEQAKIQDIKESF